MTEQSERATGPGDPSLDVIVRERSQLINLGYRLLGSLTDAEDIVQDAYARWYAMSRSERSAIDSPGAWLSRVVSRLCLNVLGSARARRERYVGEWVPEPVPKPTEWVSGRSSPGIVDPADRVTLDESVTMAFLVLLEAMTPAERVAFILHDVFRYPFAEVSEILGRSHGACRQLASSGRRRVDGALVPTSVPVGRQARIIRAFKDACATGDVERLVGLLDPEATVVADGGGLARTALRPIRGADQIARYALRIMHELDETMLFECGVNGQPGLVVQRSGVIESVVAFQIEGNRITRIWAVRNPEKLSVWTTRQRSRVHE